MASTTALFTGLSGLIANSRRLDVIGNNIANVNTAAFKSSRMMFGPTFSRNFSLGTAPSATGGGSNPSQVGLGVAITGTQRSFTNGAISATGVATDVAIEGDGFFIVQTPDGQYYTRGGSFQRNANNDLVTLPGARVMGFGIDSNFEIVEGQLQALNIPVGTLTVAEATRNVNFNGNLAASGAPATTGSVHESAAIFSDNGLGTAMTGGEDLTGSGTDLFIDDGTGAAALALEGGAQAIITISGIEKGGSDLGTHTFGFMSSAQAQAAGVDAFGSTMDDFVAYLEQVLGLDSSTVDGQTLGGNITINGNGQIIITGNEGTVQDIDIDAADLSVSYAGTPAGSPLSQPFSFTKSATADGESTRTSFIVYDSLGTPLTVDLTFVLQEAVPGAGTTWEFIAESGDSDDPSRIVGLGVVEFDSNGMFVSTSNDAIQVVRQNGAETPLSVTLNFTSDSDSITAFTGSSSTLAAVFQDGSAVGTLSSFSIGEDGLISGTFTNGLTRTIGQIALAKFANNEGLIDAGNNLFAAGPNSGTPLVTSPLEFGAGRLLGGALELANVDLSQEFINMILASTGYSAASRVITTTDELLEQLLLLGR